MDELHDYRFYTEDILHPNQIAINYIWECFKTVWMSQDAVAIMEKVEEIQKGLNHKAFNEKSELHNRFLKTLKEKQNLLKKDYPHILF